MFQKIYLEISNICNLQCTFCPVVERDKATMEEGALRQYLQKIKLHTERVCFHLMGEPLGHKEFPRFVAIAQEMGVSLEITTNGTLLNLENEKALLSSAVVQVNFSVQSFFDNFPQSDPQTYMQKIIHFASTAQTRRPDLYVNFRLWNLDADKNQENRTEVFLKELEKTFSKTINRKVDPGFNKSKKIVDRIYLHFDSRFEWPSSSSDFKSKRGTCYGTRTHVAIHANGTVVPCCLDKEANIPLGSLKSQSLEEILVSPRYTNMKKGFEEGHLVEEFCQKCTYIQRF